MGGRNASRNNARRWNQRQELLPGLPQSQNGGAYKTKILKPMAEVTRDDVLEALPPSFQGGLRSMERLCLQARDGMLGQITQLFAEDDVEGKTLMAKYLMESLHTYINQNCEPPEWGQEYAKIGDEDENNASILETQGSESMVGTKVLSGMASEGTENIVMKRPKDSEHVTRTMSTTESKSTATNTTKQSSSSQQTTSTVSLRRKQQAMAQRLDATTNSSSSLLARLSEREHAPGVRRPGCPCCDPDDPSNASMVYQLMQL
jgi:hypothetical protein